MDIFWNYTFEFTVNFTHPSPLLQTLGKNTATVPVTINWGLVFLESINYKLHIIICLRLDMICISVDAVTKTTNWLPTKQVGTQHPVTSIIVLSIWETKCVLKKMFYLRKRRK